MASTASSTAGLTALLAPHARIDSVLALPPGANPQTPLDATSSAVHRMERSTPAPDAKLPVGDNGPAVQGRVTKQRGVMKSSS